MFYHASPIKDIKVLEPRISNHNIPYVYFSDKMEFVLVYLSNAIEKYAKETNFKYDGIYSKWGPYGFTFDGKLRLEEYYPNAIYETYKNVSGYIYEVENAELEKLSDIPHAYVSKKAVNVSSFIYIPDAYEAIMKEVEKGNIVLVKYDDFIKDNKEWLEKTIKKEYEEAIFHPEYRHFLEAKFDFLNLPTSK